MSTFDTSAPLLAKPSARALAAVREVALLGGVFVLYELGRHLIRNRAGLAFTNADDVLSLERTLRLPSELGLQHQLLASDSLVRAANVFYVSVHFPATIAFLIWMWVRRPRSYVWARSLLVSVTMVALVVHVTFPLAPPRLLSGQGFVDTMAVYGPSAYRGGTQSVTNQFAAMPSLHAAWALVIGVALVSVLRTRWRWAALLHPTLTTVVVVATANHYWLDVLAATGLVTLAGLMYGFAPLPGAPGRGRWNRDSRPVVG